MLWIGQGLGMVGGSGMSGQTIVAVLGRGARLGGSALAWQMRRSAAR
jgi:hypothetical protein